MTTLVAESWGMLMVRGIAALAFGLIALLWPGLTLLVLIAFFAAYVIVSGIAELVRAYRRRHQRGWWPLLVLGVLSIVAGVIAIAYPGITAVALVIIMGVTAITWGIIDIAVAVRLRRLVRNEWLLAFAGIVSILFGVLVLIFRARSPWCGSSRYTRLR